MAQNNQNKPVGITVRLTPRANRNEVSGVMQDGSYKIKITAPPVDGKANQALIKYIAEKLQINTTDIEIKAGQTGRRKILLISGMDIHQIDKKLLQ